MCGTGARSSRVALDEVGAKRELAGKRRLAAERRLVEERMPMLESDG